MVVVPVVAIVSVIDLFAGLKVANRGTRNARMTIEFVAPDMQFSADERAQAGEVATAIADTIKSNLLTGKAPDGSPLPASAAGTRERREARLEQAARGGAPAARYRDATFIAKAKRNWAKRFKAAQSGIQAPQQSTVFGIESGLLARSVAAAPSKAGGGWTVFFAVVRAKLDRTGASAVLRVFKRIPVWGPNAMAQAKVQAALAGVRDALFSSRAERLLRELQRTAQLTQALAEAGE
jgi:hypothetical protein